ELGNVGHAVGGRFGADCVQHADQRDHGGEKVRPLGHRAADQNAASAAAEDAESRAGGVVLRDEIFGTGDEVLPGVGLGRLVARLVPVVAVDAAAAHVGDSVDAAALEPGKPHRL